MSDNGSGEAERRFLVGVEKRWKLWIPPLLALLYFALVIAIVVFAVDLRVANQDLYLVLGGVALFAVLAVWELALLVRVRPRRARARKAKAPKRAAAVEPVESEAAPEEEPTATVRPIGGGVRLGDAEYVLTADEHQGRRVLEISLPPKSRHRGAVYSKAYVPIDTQYTLRVEDLVADRAEVQVAR